MIKEPQLNRFSILRFDTPFYILMQIPLRMGYLVTELYKIYQTKEFEILANISNPISETSNSFLLIMSYIHIRYFLPLWNQIYEVAAFSDAILDSEMMKQGIFRDF